MKGKELKLKRVYLGFTQSELADVLEVNSNTVSRWETELLAIPKTVELALEALEKRQREKEQKAVSVAERVKKNKDLLK